jgi:hypothetical protein
MGDGAMASSTTGSNNVGIGSNALGRGTNTGDNNTATGYQTLMSNTNGAYNTAIGSTALLLNTTGNYNTAVGSVALTSVTTGIGNTAIGFWAGYSNVEITTGSYNTLVGYYASADDNARTNTIVIAGNDNLSLGGDNRVRIGNSSMSSIGGQVGWTQLSDERIKQNVNEDVKGLAFILRLKPVTYNYNITKENHLQNKRDTANWTGKYNIEKIRFTGFMAQQVEKAAEEAGYKFSGVDKPETENGLWGLRYSEFTVPLVKGMQEQQITIENLQIQIDELKKQNAHLLDLVKK